MSLINKEKRENVIRYLQILSSSARLSKLYSDSTTPYLVPRSVENIYCLAFDAVNLGRADCSADASLNSVGIGIKTFLHGNGRTLQKIAEFNKDAHLYRGMQPQELIIKIGELRNERINMTKRTYELSEMIYHCVTRSQGLLQIHEIPMDHIQIEHIKNVKLSNKNTLTFEDGLNFYSFNITKSTLYKRFVFGEPLFSAPVSILEDPYTFLNRLLPDENVQVAEKSVQYTSVAKDENTPVTSQNDYVILPLFSDRGEERHVPERSGLNQWNAGGRSRHPNEIYIPIPKKIHTYFPKFFPNRDHSFTLLLPNETELSAKVCQDGSKALMSNPNKELGHWLLRTIFNLDEYELLTYEYLAILGIDSVRIEKHNESTFSIDFCEVGTYDDFQTEFMF